MFEAEKVNSITEMWEKLSEENLPAGYTLAKMVFSENDSQDADAAASTPNEFVITIRLEELDSVLGLPVIPRNFTIFSQLNYRMHVDGSKFRSGKCPSSQLVLENSAPRPRF